MYRGEDYAKPIATFSEAEPARPEKKATRLVRGDFVVKGVAAYKGPGIDHNHKGLKTAKAYAGAPKGA